MGSWPSCSTTSAALRTAGVRQALAHRCRIDCTLAAMGPSSSTSAASGGSASPPWRGLLAGSSPSQMHPSSFRRRMPSSFRTSSDSSSEAVTCSRRMPMWPIITSDMGRGGVIMADGTWEEQGVIMPGVEACEVRAEVFTLQMPPAVMRDDRGPLDAGRCGLRSHCESWLCSTRFTRASSTMRSSSAWTSRRSRAFSRSTSRAFDSRTLRSAIFRPISAVLCSRSARSEAFGSR
mmetsp:Transcript_60816/g.156752  ORF Transcript_60816/g.156752 Transcript_60816/m.156752 type:complete len:234 (-) Transcript_60816:17-718(-)